MSHLVFQYLLEQKLFESFHNLVLIFVFVFHIPDHETSDKLHVYLKQILAFIALDSGFYLLSEFLLQFRVLFVVQQFHGVLIYHFLVV